MEFQKLQEDINILKIQNKNLQKELSYEKDERIKISAILALVIDKLKQNGIDICEEKKEEIVEEINDDEMTLPPTPVAIIEEDKKTQKSEELFIENKKLIKINTFVDNFDELSDDEDFEESVDLQLTQSLENIKNSETPKTYSQLPDTIVSEEPELLPTIIDDQTLEDTLETLNENIESLKINTNEPPLPTNLSTSPMTPKEERIDEEIQEENTIQENINYSKMKVGELKKLCKSRGIKGYSKMKKKQLIELLQ